jgi:agmatinase
MTSDFDPDAAALPGSGIFGLSCDPEAAGVQLLGVPFDATTSYRKGAAHGPAAILGASHQVDLFDALQATWPGSEGKPWQAGISLELDEHIAQLNAEAAPLAQAVIERAGVIAGDAQLEAGRARVDEIGDELNQRVLEWTGDALDEGKLVGILGGDHASPFGAIQAAALRHPRMGILHFDAHADLREAYEGFRWSHASILHNVLELLPAVERVLSVGLRDVGEREAQAIAESDGRVHAIYDHEWAAWRTAGVDLGLHARDHLEALPDELWISFDIDGLDPTLCPNTGTPVPGGLSWDDAMLWLGALVQSKKRIVGFDLCEVSPGVDASAEHDSWDAMVAARLLYRLIGASLLRREKA